MRDAGPHILIVDDDPSVIEALKAGLRGAYLVHGAATGEEACALLQAFPISAIILDAMLGSEHGLDLIERLRALSRAPIMILTRKPVNLKELSAALSRLMHEASQPVDPLERARCLLVEHPERPHTTGSLAREVGLSERHLCRQFRDALGMTPRRYLTRVRLERTAGLLRDTRLGVEQIARAVGYPSVGSFNRIFKRAYGLAPSEWRSGYTVD
jgi:AraC-like DNA-binding protein